MTSRLDSEVSPTSDILIEEEEEEGDLVAEGEVKEMQGGDLGTEEEVEDGIPMAEGEVVADILIRIEVDEMDSKEIGERSNREIHGNGVKKLYSSEMYLLNLTQNTESSEDHTVVIFI